MLETEFVTTERQVYESGTQASDGVSTGILTASGLNAHTTTTGNESQSQLPCVSHPSISRQLALSSAE